MNNSNIMKMMFDLKCVLSVVILSANSLATVEMVCMPSLTNKAGRTIQNKW
jgi:hypothetical protein